MNRTSVCRHGSSKIAIVCVVCVLSVVLQACGGGEGQDPDPLVEDYGIAFVRRPLVVDMNNMLLQPYQAPAN